MGYSVERQKEYRTPMLFKMFWISLVANQARYW